MFKVFDDLPTYIVEVIYSVMIVGCHYLLLTKDMVRSVTMIPGGLSGHCKCLDNAVTGT